MKELEKGLKRYSCISIVMNGIRYLVIQHDFVKRKLMETKHFKLYNGTC